MLQKSTLGRGAAWVKRPPEDKEDWAKRNPLRELTKFSCNETENLEGEHERGGWGSGSSLFLACTHLGMPFQLPKQSSGNRI